MASGDVSSGSASSSSSSATWAGAETGECSSSDGPGDAFAAKLVSGGRSGGDMCCGSRQPSSGRAESESVPPGSRVPARTAARASRLTTQAAMNFSEEHRMPGPSWRVRPSSITANKASHAARGAAACRQSAGRSESQITVYQSNVKIVAPIGDPIVIDARFFAE